MCTSQGFRVINWGLINMEGHSLDNDNLFPEFDPAHCFNGHLSPPQTSIITIDHQQQHQHSHQVHHLQQQHQHDPNNQVKLYAHSEHLGKSLSNPPFHSIQVYYIYYLDL